MQHLLRACVIVQKWKWQFFIVNDEELAFGEDDKFDKLPFLLGWLWSKKSHAVSVHWYCLLWWQTALPLQTFHCQAHHCAIIVTRRNGSDEKNDPTMDDRAKCSSSIYARWWFATWWALLVSPGGGPHYCTHLSQDVLVLKQWLWKNLPRVSPRLV